MEIRKESRGFGAQKSVEAGLGQPEAVERRGVEVAAAGRPHRVEHQPGFLLGHRPIEVAERRAAESELGEAAARRRVASRISGFARLARSQPPASSRPSLIRSSRAMSRRSGVAPATTPAVARDPRTDPRDAAEDRDDAGDSNACREILLHRRAASQAARPEGSPNAAMPPDGSDFGLRQRRHPASLRRGRGSIAFGDEGRRRSRLGSPGVARFEIGAGFAPAPRAPSASRSLRLSTSCRAWRIALSTMSEVRAPISVSHPLHGRTLRAGWQNRRRDVEDECRSDLGQSARAHASSRTSVRRHYGNGARAGAPRPPSGGRALAEAEPLVRAARSGSARLRGRPSRAGRSRRRRRRAAARSPAPG